MTTRLHDFARRLGVGALAGIVVALAASPASAQQEPVEQPGPETGTPDTPRTGDLFETARTLDEQQGGLVVESRRTLGLESAVDLVATSNLDVQIAQERVAQARILQDRAWSLILPVVTVQGIYTYNDKAIESEPFPGVKFTVRPQDELRFQGTARISVFNGKAYPLLKGAYLTEDLQQKGVEQLQHELRYAVAQLFYQMLTFKRLTDITDESLKAREIVLQAARSRLAAGVATPFEVTRAESAVLSVRNELEAHKLAFLKGREALAAFLRTEPDFDIAEPRKRGLPDATEEFVTDAWGRRPDVALQRLQADYANLEKEANLWQYAPTLAAQFNLSRAPETSFAPDPWQWNLQLIASWTLYDGGMREADVAESNSKIRSAALQIDKIEVDVRKDLRVAFLDAQSYKVQLQTVDQEIELAEKALQQAQDGYAAGAIKHLDVLDAEVQLRLARSNRARLLLAYDLAVENIYRVAGIGVAD